MEEREEGREGTVSLLMWLQLFPGRSLFALPRENKLDEKSKGGRKT